ncbi:MAG: site-specific DNA-methyltransferase [Gemmatimonadota bacterium]|nr:site-specific DNA-methyltransferase [Gemmatimonadota bacterium]
MAKGQGKPSTVRGKAAKATPVEAIKHKDARVNIPTHELRDFVRADESTPSTLLYPRDPSLDPQLVWKGKDEQDRQDLAVPIVPIYIQEKIHPQALVENLRDTAKPGEPEPELSLFADFNGIEDFDRKVDFYHHEGHWSNRMILGDSLLVMASLTEKEGLKGKVQCIYFDPPYGIKFGSNWQVSTRKRDVKDGKVEDATRQPEQVRAFRDTWKLGVHSYLAYLRARLVTARELLTETGSVFVQIGDDNVHLVRSLLDETFGPENFCSQIVFRKTTGKGGQLLDNTYDVLLWYCRNRGVVKYRALYDARTVQDDVNLRFVEFTDGIRRELTADEVSGNSVLAPGSRVFRPNPLTNQRPAQGNDLREFEFEGRAFTPGAGTFRTDLEGMRRLAATRRLLAVGKTLTFIRYLDDFPFKPRNDIWDDTRQSGFGDPKIYVVQTTTRVVERCLLMTTDPGDLVLDPTCGSGTTAYVAEQWGRRWITIDTSRVALALARTRLMSARFPYYLLADSPEGVVKESEITQHLPSQQKTEGDIRKGFVYRRVPHVTLKSIANNPEIEEGMTHAEIDAAIAKHAETELLYDKPYEDGKCVRVAGPFTVESLSPHRVLSTDEDRPASEIEGKRSSPPAQFETMIIENLRKAGVQNTRKGERLVFDTLDVHAGTWVNAAGTYTDSSGTVRRVAVSIGPEHGTVGPMQVKEAAKEAVQGVGYDTLVVCGFAFDPHVSEEVKRYGNLTVLAARMNPDLAMGDELLKKTGVGNLFMVFGEPDLDVRTAKDGKLVVEIRGLDVYDPTTGEIRSSSTDDIACWFIDTMYNGESFFVRHAYFTGADDPYEKLKRALRAEIDEDAWQSLYSTVSRPFDAPETKKIAVKVINHYGDEVLKVIEIE